MRNTIKGLLIISLACLPSITWAGTKTYCPPTSGQAQQTTVPHKKKTKDSDSHFVSVLLSQQQVMFQYTATCNYSDGHSLIQLSSVAQRGNIEDWQPVYRLGVPYWQCAKSVEECYFYLA